MKKLNKKGFTIVELVIVIAVIAILAGVLIPTFATVVDKANKSSAEQQARNFYTLLEAATAAPTTYKTYTMSMQKTGLVVKNSGNDNLTPNELLNKLLGDDIAKYYGANVSVSNVDRLKQSSPWTIEKVYFQPKGSKYYVIIDLVAGTVGEAVKIDDTNKMPASITLSKFTEANTGS